MVEFGLKLEDNKVAEWSEKYIDYEKLKNLLDKAKAAIKKKTELEKRKPELAEEIIAAYREGKGPVASTGTPYSSKLSLTALDASQPITEEMTEGQIIVDHVPSAESERESLLTQRPEKYGSQDSLAGDPPSESVKEDGSLSISFKKAVSGVSGYFSASKYEYRVREALKNVDDHHAKFEQCLSEEFAKVNTFYYEKMDELDKRLSVLVDSAIESPYIQTTVTKQHQRRETGIKKFLRSSVQGILKKDNKERFPSISEPDDVEDVEMKEMHEGMIRESDSIQRALADLYRTSKLLHNFAIMNYTGFIKIIKKHDKVFPYFKGSYKTMTQSSEVCDGASSVEELSGKMEKYYADWFCDSNLLDARAQLLPKRGDGLEMDWSQLRLGYRMGMCAILGLWVCWDCIWGLYKDGNSTIGGRTAFPVFRAVGGLLVVHWCWGISVYVWTRYRINYIYLFDFNPNNVSSAISIFNVAVDNTFVFLLCMLLYYKSGSHDIPQIVPAGMFPFFLVVLTVKNLIFPWKQRGPLWQAMREVVTTPFCSPRFFTTYVADVFTSMVKVFQDIAWTIGFVVSGDFFLSEDDLDPGSAHEWQHSFWYRNVLIPLICLFPLWFRFNQCLRRYLDTGDRVPNLPNAFKYAMSQTVTLFGAFHPLYLDYTSHHAKKHPGIHLFQLFWMALFLASSLYSFIWDVYMDWGLGKPKYGFLGRRLMFPHRSYYYSAILADLVLRSMWVLTLLPPDSGAKFEVPQYLTAVTMSLELLRRTMWGFFRLENEHRTNTGHYRRVDFVPLHFNTGHKHKYKQEREHVGWSVLAEVAAVSLLVIGVSVSSVIAAQRASRHLLQVKEDL